jgi:hypothetical protein
VKHLKNSSSWGPPFFIVLSARFRLRFIDTVLTDEPKVNRYQTFCASTFFICLLVNLTESVLDRASLTPQWDYVLRLLQSLSFFTWDRFKLAIEEEIRSDSSSDKLSVYVNLSTSESFSEND